MRSKGRAAELEARRRLAVQRVGEGWTRKDVAAFLGVHPETVAEWVRAHAAGGDAALAAKPHPGRKPFLTPGQEKRVLGWLAAPPTKHGFRTDLWTARRVADFVPGGLADLDDEVIGRVGGVKFAPGLLRNLWEASDLPFPNRRRVKQG